MGYHQSLDSVGGLKAGVLYPVSNGYVPNWFRIMKKLKNLNLIGLTGYARINNGIDRPC